MQEITRLANLPVYTPQGTFVGNVKNLVLDLAARRIEGILVGRTNPDLVEGGRDVNIPFRWAQSFSDILLLRYFPERVGSAPTEGAAEAQPGPQGTEFERIEPVEAPPKPAARTRVAARSA